LPAPKRSDERLLDVGCGEGRFVLLAQSLGFKAMGLDPDQRAIEMGRQNGLDIREGSLPSTQFAETGFSHITLSHVLEHLHEPKLAIRQSFGLLRPGGRIWLSQPNLGALGLKKFGRNWRGLEAPRHLSLFDFDSLSSLLDREGFVDVQLLAAEEAAAFYYRQSAAMADNLDPYQGDEPPGWTEEIRNEAVQANRASRRDPRLSESLTVVAWKPS